MAATIKVYVASGGSDGSPATWNTIDTTDSAKVSFDRSATYNGTAAPVTIPTTAGNKQYSYIRNVKLYCTAQPGTSSISNIKMCLASAPTSGLMLFYKTGTYLLPASGNCPADDATGATTPPAGYTAPNTDGATYSTIEATGGSATASAPIPGNYAIMLGSVHSTYAGGGNSNTTLPNIKFQYDEA